MKLLFPPYCRHCECPLHEQQALCHSCLDLLTLLPKEGRCTKCYARIPQDKGTCKPCRKIRHPFFRLAGCFESQGPGKSLVRATLRQNHPPHDLAAILVYHFNTLGWSLPNVITTVPRRFSRPMDPIGERVASMLNRPFEPVLYRRKNLYPAFRLKKKWHIIGKTVLLLADSMHTRTTMREAAWALQDGGPMNVYGIGICVPS